MPGPGERPFADAIRLRQSESANISFVPPHHNSAAPDASDSGFEFTQTLTIGTAVLFTTESRLIRLIERVERDSFDQQSGSSKRKSASPPACTRMMRDKSRANDGSLVRGKEPG